MLLRRWRRIARIGATPDPPAARNSGAVSVSADILHFRARGLAIYAVDADLLREVAWPAENRPLAFICGPTNFVESVAAGLVELGCAPGRVKTERFGATGGR